MNRRDWFRNSAVLSGGLFLHSYATYGNNAPYFHPLDDGSVDLIRLSYNENPHGPSKAARQAIMDSMDIAHQYPFKYIEDFTTVLAEKHGVPANHIVICGGSVEGLRAAGMAFCKPGGELIAPNPTYLSMMQYVENLGTKVVNIDVKKDLNHDLDKMEGAINDKTNLMFVCNPNNPTGTMIPSKELISFLDRVSPKVPVFVDEAYYDYVHDPSYDSMIDLVKKSYNIIISRTFSKVYGLAGLRLGYLIAKPDIAAAIRSRVQASGSIPAIKAAEASLRDEAFYKFSRAVNKEGREMISNACEKLGLEYVKPHTNFVFMKTGLDVKEFNERMKAKNILVGRPFPPLMDWCRVSTGKLEDVEKFVKILPQTIG